MGEALSKENIDFVYCSDLHRTKQTFESISNGMKKKVPVEYTKLLRERGCGIFENVKKVEVWAKVPKKLFRKRTYRPENGESYEDVFKRTNQFLKEAISRHLFSKNELE